MLITHPHPTPVCGFRLEALKAIPTPTSPSWSTAACWTSSRGCKCMRITTSTKLPLRCWRSILCVNNVMYDNEVGLGRTFASPTVYPVFHVAHVCPRVVMGRFVRRIIRSGMAFIATNVHSRFLNLCTFQCAEARKRKTKKDAFCVSPSRNNASHERQQTASYVFPPGSCLRCALAHVACPFFRTD